MAKELLDVADAGAALDRVGGVGAPQDVRRDLDLEAGRARVLADQELDGGGLDRPAVARGEEERPAPPVGSRAGAVIRRLSLGRIRRFRLRARLGLAVIP